MAKAKSIAGSDAKLLMRFENTCGALGPQRPALEAQNAGQKPEPPRPVEPVQIFDNLLLRVQHHRRLGDPNERRHHHD